MSSVYKEVEKYLVNNQFTWLITGVAGFIGSHLLQKLLTLNQKVIGIDNFYSGSQGNIDQVLELMTLQQKKNFTFHNIDIRSMEDCILTMKKVDYVLHQAAIVSVSHSTKDPAFVNEVNVKGFLNILWAAVSQKIKRVVFASSSSVYGDSIILPKTENDVCKLLTPYAASKYINELYADVFFKCYGLESIGLRYFNIFGPRQNFSSMYAGVIPIWITSILKNQQIYINGDGETSRDFCYVDNVVQANILSAVTKNNDSINQVYNIAIGKQMTLNQLFNSICDNLGKRPKPVYREFRDGDIKYSLSDISKAKKLLNYYSLGQVEKSLKDTITWYSKILKNV
jgi:UDP-N-acetylglucosamine/UDP-N-acetylgalactosamine 4-epimerase